MDREELEAALAVLLDQMEGDQGDSHEVYQRLRQILDGMRAMGMPLPERPRAHGTGTGRRFRGRRQRSQGALIVPMARATSRAAAPARAS